MASRLVLSLEPFKNRRDPTCMAPPHAGGGWAQSPGAPPWVAAAAFAALAAVSWPFTVDDAFIAVRYAQRLAAGLGYTFSDGPPTDGVTGPLWLVPLWLSARVDLDPLAAGKALGAIAAALAVARVVARVRARSGGRVAAWITLLMCLTSLPLISWSVGGLETGLATLAITELALAVTAARPSCVRAALCISMLPWLRPELAPVALYLLGVLSLRVGRASAYVWAAGALSAALLCTFRVSLFGHVLPMSAAAKPPVFAHGLAYALRALLRVEHAIALLLVVLGRPFQRRVERVLLLGLGVHALAVVLAGGDWMPGFRLFAPLSPWAGWLVGSAFASAFLRRPRLALPLLLALLGLRATLLVGELQAAREAGARREAITPLFRERLRDVSGPIAALDIGLLGYVSEAPFLDLGGLTQPEVAYAPGGHLDKRIDSAWLRDKSPALLVLHSKDPPRVDQTGHVRWFRGYPVERRVLEMEWVLRGYRVDAVIAYAPDYHYLFLKKRPGNP